MQFFAAEFPLVLCRGCAQIPYEVPRKTQKIFCLTTRARCVLHYETHAGFVVQRLPSPRFALRGILHVFALMLHPWCAKKSALNKDSKWPERGKFFLNPNGRTYTSFRCLRGRRLAPAPLRACDWRGHTSKPRALPLAIPAIGKGALRGFCPRAKTPCGRWLLRELFEVSLNQCRRRRHGLHLAT